MHKIEFWTKKIDFLKISKICEFFVTFVTFFLKFHPNSKVRTFRRNKDRKISKISSERLRCVLNRQINEIYPTLIFWLVTSLNAEIFKKMAKIVANFHISAFKALCSMRKCCKFHVRYTSVKYRISAFTGKQIMIFY